jgi:hypothetical protein
MLEALIGFHSDSSRVESGLGPELITVSLR